MTIRTADVIMPGSANAFEVGKRGQLSSIAQLPELHRSLLEKPVTAALATINAKGLPHLTPVWVGHNGTHILLNTKKGRLKERNLRARGQVSLLCVNPQNPYHWITLQGQVEEIVEETDPSKGHEATNTSMTWRNGISVSGRTRCATLRAKYACSSRCGPHTS
jgi:PPOX class probable F420-dependent enzyme